MEEQTGCTIYSARAIESGECMDDSHVFPGEVDKVLCQ
jgi:hypothetical protein